MDEPDSLLSAYYRLHKSCTDEVSHLYIFHPLEPLNLTLIPSMHFYKSILSAATLLAASIHVGATPTFPSLAYIGTLNINITAGQMIPVYGGTRVVNSYLG